MAALPMNLSITPIHYYQAQSWTGFKCKSLVWPGKETSLPPWVAHVQFIMPMSCLRFGAYVGECPQLEIKHDVLTDIKCIHVKRHKCPCSCKLNYTILTTAGRYVVKTNKI